MSEPVFFVSHFRIKEGQLDGVRQMMSEATSRLQAEKPRTALFLTYQDADRATVSFLHAFADAEAMDLHIEGSHNRSRAAYQFLEPLGWELYGDPSPAALENLRQAAASAGVPLTRHPEYVGGFLRLGSGQRQV